MYSTGLSKEERRARAGGGPDRVRSLAETADLLNISVPTLRRMIAAGTGPSVIRVSARRLGVRDSAREAFLEQNVAAHGGDRLMPLRTVDGGQP